MIKLEILYEDNDLVVCIKPRGILSQEDKLGNLSMTRLLKSHLAMEALKNAINLKKEPYVGVVHRLDRNVRGVMIYAKTKPMARALSALIREHKLKKKYMAIVSFSPENIPELNKTIMRTDYLLFDKKSNFTSIITDKNRGERAELCYKVLQIKGNKALVKIDLITGKHHQIRAQMSQIFNGIVGDTKYNGYKYGKGELSLEAIALSFVHPISKKDMSFSIVPDGREFKNFNAEIYI